MRISVRNDLAVLRNVNEKAWSRDVVARGGAEAVRRAFRAGFIEPDPFNKNRYILTGRGKKQLAQLEDLVQHARERKPKK